MKNLFIFLFGFSYSLGAWAQDVVTLDVKGMHCSSCVKTLQKEICQNMGLTSCQVKLVDKKNERGQISFINSQNVSLQQLQQKIEDLGYSLEKTNQNK